MGYFDTSITVADPIDAGIVAMFDFGSGLLCPETVFDSYIDLTTETQWT